MKPKTSHKFKVLMIMMVAIVMLAGSVITPPQARTAYADSVQSVADTAKIDAYVQSLMDKFQIPGAAVGIIKEDQVVYLKGYGISGVRMEQKIQAHPAQNYRFCGMAACL